MLGDFFFLLGLLLRVCFSVGAGRIRSDFKGPRKHVKNILDGPSGSSGISLIVVDGFYSYIILGAFKVPS